MAGVSTPKLRLLYQKHILKSPALLQSRLFSTPTSSTNHINEQIDEEVFGNRLKYFHPTQPGEILDGRFRTIAKLGFGAGSTVWLAENLKFKRWRKLFGPRYVSIKIPALDTNASGEMTKTKLITEANPSHEGFMSVRTPIDRFDLQGPEGRHICLVYAPMRETLGRFQQRLPRQRLAMPLFKPYMYLLLQALDYLHTDCHLIHTDIKEDNILVTVENESILADFAKHYKKHPQPRHIRAEDGRTIYLSQDDFGALRGNTILPQLSDFNLSFPGLPGDVGHLSAIQSHRYRAPEVFLGCAWTYSADIWNLGLLMWNLLEDISLFDRPAGQDGEYDAHVHLAQMVSLLGDPPEELVKRERMFRNLNLGKLVVNLQGKECKTMNEYWGGPFFDDNGQMMRKDLLKREQQLADTVTELQGDEKEIFLDFASGMLQWLPENRKTAKELLQYPFFDQIGCERASVLSR